MMENNDFDPRDAQGGCSPSSCESCGAACPSRQGGGPDLRAHLAPESSVKKLIGIVSGKGGVGKSMVTSLLACGTKKDGYKTGILDADITGPSIPKAFGLPNDGLAVTEDGRLLIPEKSAEGVEIISANLLLPQETEPVIWRGTLVAAAVKQFWEETLWQDMDFVFVDMPPGTGDVTLTVFQSLPVDGIIMVTTPQDLVSMIVGKAIHMAEKMDVPILGLVENMSYMLCPGCGEKIYPFGESHLEDVAAQYGLPILARIPLDPKNAGYMDAGAVEAIDRAPLEQAIQAVEKLKA